MAEFIPEIEANSRRDAKFKRDTELNSQLVEKDYLTKLETKATEKINVNCWEPPLPINDLSKTYTVDSDPLEKEIREFCNEIADFLVEKNRAYGNSVSEPILIFAKRVDTLAQIDVRIDDKLNRIKKGSEYPGDDTVKDLVGYLILREIVKRQTMMNRV